MSFIEFKKVSKTYGDQPVLDNINLSVKKGEFVTMVGASGCGKSTFLKMLSGQESASKGQCLLDGQPLTDEPSVDRGIVFQKYSVFPHLSVLDNVILGLEFAQSKLFARLFGKARAQAREKAMDLLQRVGLHSAANKYPHELSGGMQQRLAIAQALIKEPKILLLDEPFGALDPGIRADMHQLILDLWQQTGTTIFMVTHDIGEGFYLGSRLLVFDKVRHDPMAPNAWGATITYDLKLNQANHGQLAKSGDSAQEHSLYNDIQHSVHATARVQDEAGPSIGISTGVGA
jgi:NitT/TauT family transport system ATP-binding protein